MLNRSAALLSRMRPTMEWMAVAAMIVASATVLWQHRHSLMSAKQSEGATPASPLAIPLDGRHILGSPDAKIGLLAFVDFECPFCRKFAVDVLPTVVSRYVQTNKVALIVRHSPLDAIHPLALKAAVAAECADQWGGFWRAHDVLYSESARTVLLPSATIARKFNLPEADYARCVDDGETRRLVRADLDAAARVGVRTVPTLLLGTVSARELRVEQVLSGSPRLNTVIDILDSLTSSSSHH